MITVALVGGDGAGKTTIAKMLLDSLPFPVRYLYMGTNVQSSDFALPTSRLIFAVKLYLHRRSKNAARGDSKFVSTYDLHHGPDTRGSIGATARLINRLAEGWYRQAISWLFQLRGYSVVYDRHQLFDSVPSGEGQRLTDRIYHWCLTHLYPRPDLIVFLDASPNVLFARKGEATIDALQSRRTAWLKQGEKMPNFVRVDATRPVDAVFSEVTQHIVRFHEAKSSD